MRTSRKVIIAVAVVVVVILAISLYEGALASSSTSPAWSSAAEYPLQLNGAFGIAGQQCVNSTTYVYCVGGQDVNGGPRSEAYDSSTLSATSRNITGWATDPHSYPRVINGQACVAYSGYVYCVGGSYDAGGDDVASSYYAPLSGNGTTGSWISTTPYPIPIDSEYCVASVGDIFCVGGNNETDGTNADSTLSSSVWYAGLSASGIGTWSRTTPYPANLYLPSCFADGGYLYCLGGTDINNNAQSSDYFAPLSSSGVGAWKETSAYPVQVSGQACGFSPGYIFCVGGQENSNTYTNAVYFATVSSAGIGSWKQSGNYPQSVGTTCVVSSGYMYCVGGFDSSSVGENGATYFAPLSAISGPSGSG